MVFCLILEYSIIFIDIQVLFPVHALLAFLDDLLRDIKQRTSQAKVQYADPRSQKKALAWTIFNGYESVTDLSHRYVEIDKIFTAYESFVGPLLVYTLAFSVSSTVCIIYLSTINVITWPDQWLKQAVVGGIITTAGFRISAITRSGQTLHNRHSQLMKAVAIAINVGRHDPAVKEEVRLLCDADLKKRPMKACFLDHLTARQLSASTRSSTPEA